MSKRATKYLVLLLVVVGFSVVVYRGLGLVKVADRPKRETVLSQQLKERIEKECITSAPEACAAYSRKLTCELLSFSRQNDLKAGKANCVGYAILCADICNHALKTNGIACSAKPVVGYVTCYGINLCKLLQAVAPAGYKDFVKDHDFVDLDLGGQHVLFDASLDELLLDCTTDG